MTLARGKALLCFPAEGMRSWATKPERAQFRHSPGRSAYILQNASRSQAAPVRMADCFDQMWRCEDRTAGREVLQEKSTANAGHAWLGFKRLHAYQKLARHELRNGAGQKVRWVCSSQMIYSKPRPRKTALCSGKVVPTFASETPLDQRQG